MRQAVKNESCKTTKHRGILCLVIEWFTGNAQFHKKKIKKDPPVNGRYKLYQLWLLESVGFSMAH